MPDFTLSPQTSVSEAVSAEKAQLDRIEAKIDRLLGIYDELADAFTNKPPE